MEEYIEVQTLNLGNQYQGYVELNASSSSKKPCEYVWWLGVRILVCSLVDCGVSITTNCQKKKKIRRVVFWYRANLTGTQFALMLNLGFEISNLN